MADLFKHLSQFAIAALSEHYFVPGVVAGARQPYGGRGGLHPPFARPAAIDTHALPQAVELLLAGLAAHLHQVSLLHAGRSLGELVG